MLCSPLYVVFNCKGVVLHPGQAASIRGIAKDLGDLTPCGLSPISTKEDGNKEGGSHMDHKGGSGFQHQI